MKNQQILGVLGVLGVLMLSRKNDLRCRQHTQCPSARDDKRKNSHDEIAHARPMMVLIRVNICQFKNRNQLHFFPENIIRRLRKSKKKWKPAWARFPVYIINGCPVQLYMHWYRWKRPYSAPPRTHHEHNSHSATQIVVIFLPILLFFCSCFGFSLLFLVLRVPLPLPCSFFVRFVLSSYRFPLVFFFHLSCIAFFAFMLDSLLPWWRIL